MADEVKKAEDKPQKLKASDGFVRLSDALEIVEKPERSKVGDYKPVKITK